MNNSFIGQIGVILATLLGIALILYLTYISTKFIGRRFSLKSVGGKKLKVIESVSIGQGKTLLIVRVGEKTFLVGAASESIHLIGELDSSEFKEPENNLPSENGMDFKTAFKTVLENNFGKKKKKDNDKENENDGS